MVEATRLVVWDLDDTFWLGTVTEGGIRQYVQENHDTVIELARRGIMSSICSKNDARVILPILQKKGILDYFIFPSISWEPKGRRLSTLIGTVQLRPETVLFIDDNPNNRAEALAAVPGIQVEDEKFIAGMLSDPRFKGKDDGGLTRLSHYKLLEARKKDEEEAPGGNEEFLRGCDIRVLIEYDVDTHIDRAVELINRTNQLNYTKRRLPDDQEEGRRALREEMMAFNRQSGLIRVVDKYGDYGFVGFFMTETLRFVSVPGEANSRLRHFCFSCRTLGMLIEQWLYEHLRRPEMRVIGEVLTDLSVPRDIDWVRQVHSIEEGSLNHAKIAPEIVVYGGCEANAIGLYLNTYADTVTVHGNYAAGGLFVRIDSTIDALAQRDPEEFAPEAAALGLPLHLCTADIVSAARPGALFVINCSQDAGGAGHYQHKNRDWKVMLHPMGVSGPYFSELSDEDLKYKLNKLNYNDEHRNHILNAAVHLRKNYSVGPSPTDKSRLAGMRELIDRLPPRAKLIIAINHDRIRVDAQTVVNAPRITRYANLMRDLAAEYPHVEVISFSAVVASDAEIQLGGNHYNREVYLRFAECVVSTASAMPAREDPAPVML